VRGLHADVDAESDVNSISSATMVIDWNRDHVDAGAKSNCNDPCDDALTDAVGLTHGNACPEHAFREHHVSKLLVWMGLSRHQLDQLHGLCRRHSL
jgi:hypothetical protein